jgi:peptide deformylase
LNEEGKRQSMTAKGSLSELLQHEIDHLNGILAIDRAIDSKHIILRSEYEKLSSNQPVVL